MGDEVICETYVVATARALGMEIAPAHVPGVVENLRRIAAVAAALDAAALGPEDEAAPVWMP